MTNKFTLSALAFGMLVSSQAFAASNVTLNVTGTITPVACTPTLSGGGAINYGSISTSDLSETARTTLDKKSLDLTVDCAGATAPFAIRAVDNAMDSTLDLNNGAIFGLGKQGTNNIGQYTLSMQGTAQGDGSNVITMRSINGGKNWTTANGIDPTVIVHGGILYAYGENTSSTAPKPLSTLVTQLDIEPVIAPLNTLDTTTNFNFAGSATLIVEYL
ncbi:DUF1120 domain-containing protein [Buttiauxella sp. A2-C1_F]|uniref:DUF1120 domain-containing protein n=1 Tax=unclassified Buttiauxella TaxID=2634062 RepID=UPI001E2D2426|nr:MULTISPECIES: DUF1120 domain-containing protein [unclassified Buttiauxella]MCE0798955.1 DUF1120 domain-containing protein [Buttiauxella sp. W03-F01]MCE0811548.1 DUF1120 domain-containing protein [Buttiauxella sp. S04-F03]MCE0844155.1 DUF1120 domain-containing protein [Buttiauxella sp. A2-C1_F]